MCIVVHDLQGPVVITFQACKRTSGRNVVGNRITSYNVCYTKLLRDFNELGNSGVGLFDITKGFYTYEIGSNADATYRADDGTSTTGDVYSYGLTSSTERA